MRRLRRRRLSGPFNLVVLRMLDWFYIMSRRCAGRRHRGTHIPLFLVRARIKPLICRRTTDASSAPTRSLASRESRRGGVARFSSTRRCLRELLNRGLVASRFQLRRGRLQSIRQSKNMLQATGNVQVIESRPNDVRRSIGTPVKSR